MALGPDSERKLKIFDVYKRWQEVGMSEKLIIQDRSFVKHQAAQPHVEQELHIVQNSTVSAYLEFDEQRLQVGQLGEEISGVADCPAAKRESVVRRAGSCRLIEWHSRPFSSRLTRFVEVTGIWDRFRRHSLKSMTGAFQTTNTAKLQAIAVYRVETIIDDQNLEDSSQIMSVRRSASVLDEQFTANSWSFR